MTGAENGRDRRSRFADSSEDTIVGSESDIDTKITDDVTETTGLLSAGARNGSNGSGSGENSSPKNNGTWVGLEDFSHIPQWRRPSVWWLLFPYALVTLAFGGSLVPKLNLTVDLVCHRYFEDKAAQDPNFHYKPVVIGDENPQCIIPEVQRNVAAFTLILSVVIGTLSSVTAPKLGALSDRYGRRLLMSLCPIGGISSEFITVLAAKYPQYVRYEWLILGAVLEGLSGSFTAGNVLIHSYTSDCTPPSQRSVAIGYLHSCLFGGLALGPLLAGYFVKWTGSLISVFYVLLGSHIMYAIYARFGLPESLSKKRQLAAREKHAREKEQLARNPIPDWAHAAIQVVPFGAGDGLEDMVRTMRSANPFEPLRILFPKGPDAARLRRNLLTLAIIDMALLGTAMSSGQVTVLYTEFMFGWGTLEASRFISLVSAVRVLVLVAIFPVVNYIFRTLPARAKARQELQAAQDRGDTTTGLSSDRTNSGADKLDVWVLRAALISDVVGITGYVLSRTEVPFVLSACTAAVGGLGSATIQASLSKHVPAERVGQLLGAIGLLHALSRVLFPILFNGLYAATVLTYPQAFFVLLLVIFVGLLGASFLVRPHVFMKEDEPVSTLRRDESSALMRQDELEDDEVIPNQ